MLVVTDERARGVCGQRRLARAGESEKERRVARRPDVGRAVHAQHALPGHVVVHDREHGLLQLAGVARAADEDHPLGQVEHDERAAARPVTCRIRLELGRMQHREVGGEVRERGEFRTHKHVPHERHVPRVGRHVPHAEPVLLVGAAVEILHEEVVAPVEVLLHIRAQQVKVCWRDGLVHLAPVHVGLGGGLLDHELVVWRAARVRLRDGDERAHVGQLALAALDGMLHERGREVIPVHLAGGREPLSFEAAVRARVRSSHRVCRHRHHPVKVRAGGANAPAELRVSKTWWVRHPPLRTPAPPTACVPVRQRRPLRPC